MVIGLGTAIVFIVVTVIALIINGRRRSSLPPGPFPLPLIGNLYQIGKTPHIGLTKLAKTYGDLMTVTLGNAETIVISSISKAREILTVDKTAIAGRPFVYTAHQLFSQQNDEVFQDYSPKFIQLRKAMSVCLKKGHGNFSFEDMATRESEKLILRLERHKGDLDLKLDINLTILNPLVQLMLDKTYEKTDEEFHRVSSLIDTLFLGLGIGVLDFIPVMRYLPSQSNRFLKEAVQIKDDITSKMINDYIRDFDGNVSDSFIMTLFDKQDHKETMDQVKGVLCDMLVGGVETTANTVRWGFIYALYWPKVQQRIQDELDRVVGRGNTPDLSHRQDCIYLLAFINEVLRMSTLAPLGLPHKATRTFKVDGLIIPKGCQVLLNLWGIHYDEREWERPSEFDPNRFIDEDGKLRALSSVSILPFSAGARSCIGEIQGRMQLFLIFSRVFHHFNIQQPHGEDLPSLEGILGLTNVPKRYNVTIEKRID